MKLKKKYTKSLKYVLLKLITTAFSKAKSEQTTTLSVGNKNLREVLVAFIPNFDPKKRYKVSGEFDAENRVMYYDMTTAVESAFRVSKE